MSLRDDSHSLNGDRKLEQDIRAEVALWRDVGDEHPVGIAVEHGVVHLTGSTETYAQKWAIARAASRVVGVQAVRDYLDVRPHVQDECDDGQIQAAATAALRLDARVPVEIRAHVTDGVVRLNGQVERFAQREAAEEAVRNLVGLRDVVNEIALVQNQSSSDLTFDVAAAIRRRFAFGYRSIDVTVHDGVVRLKGLVATFAILDDVERVVRSIPGVKRIENQLLVATEADLKSEEP